jgi:hypothetical protein
VIPISFQDKKIRQKMAIRVTGAFMGLVPLPALTVGATATIFVAVQPT